MNKTDKVSGLETAAKMRLRLWLRLLKVTRGVELQVRDNLRRQFATTLPRFDVMAALSHYSAGLKMSQLSGVLRVSNGNVTGIVDRLVTDGFIARVAVRGDRRASLVRLTQKGIQEFALQAAAHERWVDGILSGFSGDEAKDISDGLEQGFQRSAEKVENP